MLRLMCVRTDRDDLSAEFMIALNDVLCRVRMTESVLETASVDLNPFAFRCCRERTMRGLT